MRKLFLCLMLATTSAAMAQEYKVYTTVGSPIVITPNGQLVLKKKDLLTALSEIIIPYNSKLELFDEANRKHYILKSPGRGIVGNMLQDGNNSIISLSDRYFNLILNNLNSKNANGLASDGAGITRDSLSVKMEEPLQKEE